ncbi:hypothetical protein, partial [Oleiphilus sp. HI0061]|uniref:hypothetical protein n=1 Tax=Oleiphilus sp. HI0061 TaxID=1822239 RepID=UPI001E38F1EE
LFICGVAKFAHIILALFVVVQLTTHKKEMTVQIGSQSTPEWLLLRYLSPLMLGFSMVLIPLNMLRNRALNKFIKPRSAHKETWATLDAQRHARRL